MIAWHRLFGLTLMDFFTDSAYEVELEKDLSVKQQLLDVLIIEKRDGEQPDNLPDGLENLSAHNLVTFKSHQQSLDSWALDELIGHFVNYRKQISPSFEALLPVDDFQLFGISTRYPKKLMDERVSTFVKEGVYDIRWGSRMIRLIVLSRIAQSRENALWHLFSAKTETVKFGAENYQWRSSDSSSVINDLFHQYNLEGIKMPYTIEDYRKDYVKRHLHKLSPDELLKNLSPDDRLKGLSPVELKKLLLNYLSGLKREEIEYFVKDILEKENRANDSKS